MKHHFADFLPRDQNYWTITPNRERYGQCIANVVAGNKKVSVVTLGKEDQNWAHVLTLPKLEELTLHEPTAEQLLAVRASCGIWPSTARWIGSSRSRTSTF